LVAGHIVQACDWKWKNIRRVTFAGHIVQSLWLKMRKKYMTRHFYMRRCTDHRCTLQTILFLTSKFSLPSLMAIQSLPHYWSRMSQMFPHSHLTYAVFEKMYANVCKFGVTTDEMQPDFSGT
jgi:hypothetical protein